MQTQPLRSLWVRYLSIPLYLAAVMVLAKAVVSVQSQWIPASAAPQPAAFPFTTLMYGVVAQMFAFLIPAPLLLFLTGGRNYTFARTESRYLVVACGLILVTLISFSLIYAALDIKPNQLAYLDMKDILKNKGAFLFLTALIVPAYEEWIFRGLLFGILVTETTRRREAVFATIFVSLLFTAVHIEGAHSLSALPAIFAMSLVLHLMTWKSGSLWPAFCAHSLQNLLAASTMLAAAAKSAAR